MFCGVNKYFIPSIKENKKEWGGGGGGESTIIFAPYN